MARTVLPPVRNGDVGDWRLADREFMASFRLPAPSDKVEALAARNPMPRESRISFDEKSHTYTVDSSVRVPRSVTGWLHSFTSGFDAPRVAGRMRDGRYWEDKKERYRRADGELMSNEEIVQQWSDNGEVQRARGQLLHWQAEQYLNGREVEQPHSPEFGQFLTICRDVIAPFFSVIRTEVCLFHCGLRMAGQADMICRDASGSISIWDWKRARDITYENKFQALKPPLDHLCDTNYWIYAMQLNTYKFFLASEYGMTVSSMYLGVVHPTRLTPQVIKLPNLEGEMSVLVRHEIDRGAATEPIPGERAPFLLL